MNKNMDVKQSEKNSTYSGALLLDQNEKYLLNYNNWLSEKIIDQIGPKRKLKILDFGAGTGTLLKKIQQKVNLPIDAVELDPQQRAILRSCEVVCFQSMDFIENTKYDFIYTSNVLEHIEDDIGSVQKLYSLLNPGGSLVIYVPALSVLWTALDDRVGHFRRYNKKDLNFKLISSGFDVCESYYCDSFGGILALIFKLITRSDTLPSDRSLWIYDRVLFHLNKITDLLFKGFFGKNIFVVAKKPFI